MRTAEVVALLDLSSSRGTVAWLLAGPADTDPRPPSDALAVVGSPAPAVTRCSSSPLEPLMGLGVFLGYVVVVALAAIVLMRRRDV